MRFAFKEWAVICRALAMGKQALILRKGGIAEEGGIFRPDHGRFWLLPTYLHQKAEGLKAEAATWLPTVESERAPSNVIHLTHYVEVPGVFHAERLNGVLELDRLHVWSEATIRQRFAYRQPGLFVLPARVFVVAEPVEVPNLAEYDGCKTWVDLGAELPASGTPVLSDRQFGDVLEGIDQAMNPIRVA
jgi:hypothetical protein